MKKKTYLDLKAKVIRAGYGKEVEWSESIEVCTAAGSFFNEYIWIVLNAGMKNQVARKIYDKIKLALFDGKPISEVFGHTGKVLAIERMRTHYHKTFNNYKKAEDKLAFLESLPWIGGITKYHLAKNLGIDCVKPDRHLVRIAKTFGTKPLEMCKKLSDQTGDKLAAVDTVIWRAANLGFI